MLQLRNCGIYARYLTTMTIQQAKQVWKKADAVCFDVDSTVCMDEGIDELAAFCGRGKEVSQWQVLIIFLIFQGFSLRANRFSFGFYSNQLILRRRSGHFHGDDVTFSVLQSSSLRFTNFNFIRLFLFKRKVFLQRDNLMPLLRTRRQDSPTRVVVSLLWVKMPRVYKSTCKIIYSNFI